MRAVLHILTKPEPPLARELIRQQSQMAHLTVEVFDLTQPEPNYPALVEKIFAADSLQVW
jgi:hypothetical protein